MIKFTTTNIAKVPDGRHADAIGQNLYLDVRNSGRSKAWQFRYSRDGKPETINIGPLRRVTIADARIKATALRAVLDSGKDPKHAPIVAPLSLFKDVTLSYYERELGMWRSSAHAAQWLSSMENHVWPKLGTRDSASILPNDVRDTLSELWETNFPTAKVVLGRIRAVLDFAIANDDHARFPHGNAAAAAVGRMKRKPRVQVPHRSLDWRKAPALYAALVERGDDDVPAMALRFLLLCCCPRAAEIISARWDEIHGDVLKVPETRMKGGKKRDIPLSRAAVDLVALIPRTKDFIFVGRDGRWVGKEYQKFSGHMHPDAMLVLLHAMKVDGDVHGMRATFKDWATEKQLDHDATELALDHKIGGVVEELYRRTNLMERRRILAEQWAAYLTVLPPGQDR